jgi:hypothetical protein
MRTAEMNTSDVNRTTNFNHERRSAIATRAARGIRRVLAIVLASVGLLFLMLASPEMMKARPSASITGAEASSRTFVTAYGNTIRQVEYGLTPESVVATSDGGHFALALTDSRDGFLKNWLLKLSASGRPLPRIVHPTRLGGEA